VPPHESPDERWHLFAHSPKGIHHHVSNDGLSWQRQRGVVVRDARGAHLFVEAGRYVLLYERKPADVPLVWRDTGARWSSWIEAITSTDLERWSSPTTILSPTLAWHASTELGRAVGSPCCVRLSSGSYALYYGAGLVRLNDCGRVVSRAVGVALAPSPLGPFRAEEAPLLEADPADAGASLGAGSLRVLPVDDGFVALQSGFYTDTKGRSRGALRSLASADGLAFSALGDAPLLAPGDGWKRAHVLGADIRRLGGRFRIYFHAASAWHWIVAREGIGMADLA
jgi:hypothetical protein